jgi:hypothetical protein
MRSLNFFCQTDAPAAGKFFFLNSTSQEGETFALSNGLLNGYFPATYNSTKYQQVIHNLRKEAKNPLFEFWLSFFSFVHLTLTAVEIQPTCQSPSKSLIKNTGKGSFHLSVYILVNIKTY